MLATSPVISSSVPVHGFTQLGLRSHPIGLSTSEAAAMTLSFFRSDKPVYTTASVRPIGPCQPTLALAGPIFSYFGNSHLALPGGHNDIYRRLFTGDKNLLSTLLCTVVDLFMWPQAQGIVLRARHIPGCLNMIAERLSRPNQPITTE